MLASISKVASTLGEMQTAKLVGVLINRLGPPTVFAALLGLTLAAAPAAAAAPPVGVTAAISVGIAAFVPSPGRGLCPVSSLFHMFEETRVTQSASTR